MVVGRCRGCCCCMGAVFGMGPGRCVVRWRCWRPALSGAAALPAGSAAAVLAAGVAAAGAARGRRPYCSVP